MNPNRLELEQQIVWSAVYAPESFARYAKALPTKFFEDDHCRIAIDAMHRMIDLGTEINLVNINAMAGERIILPEHTEQGTVDLSIAARRLTEMVILQKRTDMVQRLIDEEDPFSAMKVVNDLSNEFASIVALHSRRAKSVIVQDWVELMEKNLTGHSLHVPTGFPSLDRWCHGGLKLGNMSFLGGGPGTGKTSFMLKIAMHAAGSGYKTTFLEGEMPNDEILSRMAGQHMRLPVHEIEEGRHLDRVIGEFAGVIDHVEFDLCGTFERNAAALMASIRDAVHQGAKLIMVDYLQVFVEKNGRANDEFNKIKQLSEMIRKMTLMNNVHIMAASSLNRLEAGQKDVTLNSFYGGSQLGHDCNTAIILANAEGAIQGEATRTLDCKMVKNRGGYTGSFEIAYELATQDMREQAGEQVVAPVQDSLKFNPF